MEVVIKKMPKFDLDAKVEKIQGIVSKFNPLAKKQKKKEDLQELNRWILGIVKDVEKAKEEKGSMGFHLQSRIDFDKMTREDLEVLQPSLKKLHDICQEQNIAVDLVSGFDLLPRTYSTAKYSYSTQVGAGNFEIYVDKAREYNFAINPFADKPPVITIKAKRGLFR